MQIDLFTLGAQIVNFLILVFLLNRFLYRPILRVMNERQSEIARRYKEADEEKAAARREAGQLREEREQLEARRDEMMEEVHQEVEQRRKEEIRAVREEVDELRGRWKRGLQEDQEEFFQYLRQQIGARAGEISRRVLADMADSDLENQVVKTFTRRLRAVDSQVKKDLANAIKDEDNRVVILSAFELDDDHRSRLLAVVREEILDGEEIYAEFERVSDLICGIDLHAGGFQISWNFEAYLDDLKEHLQRVLRERAEFERDRLDGDRDAVRI